MMHSTTLFTILSSLLLISTSIDALPTRRFSSRRTTRNIQRTSSSSSKSTIPLLQVQDQSITNLNRIKSGSALADYTTTSSTSSKVNSNDASSEKDEEVRPIRIQARSGVPHLTLLSGSGMKVREEVL